MKTFQATYTVICVVCIIVPTDFTYLFSDFQQLYSQICCTL